MFFSLMAGKCDFVRRYRALKNHWVGHPNAAMAMRKTFRHFSLGGPRKAGLCISRLSPKYSEALHQTGVGFGRGKTVEKAGEILVRYSVEIGPHFNNDFPE